MEAALARFGQNVRAARLARGWTQEELSRQTGLASVQISRIERGRREIRITTLSRARLTPGYINFGGEKAFLAWLQGKRDLRPRHWREVEAA